jgi:hypothetical protein
MSGLLNISFSFLRILSAIQQNQETAFEKLKILEHQQLQTLGKLEKLV